MKSSKTYIIHGDPTPLARPRMGNSRVWDSQKHLKFGFGIQVSAQHGSLPLFVGPLHLDVIFYFDIKKVALSKRESLHEGYHIRVPDTDNCIKYLLDCCNTILYADDCIISQITAKKLYSDIPRTEFTIYELE